MSRERNPLLTAFAVLVYAFLFAPIVVLIIFSFNDSRRTFVWHGFTTEWYGKLLANDDLLAAVGTTVQVGLVAVVVSTVLGSLLGLGLARLRFRGHGSTETLLLLPMVTPEIVMGLSLLLFFVALFDSRGSFAQLSIAHITFCISFVAVVVRSRAAGMNPHLEEAARDLGASAWGAFRHVTLPLIAPGIVAGAPAGALAEHRRLRRLGVQRGDRQHDAAALHLQRDQVRGLARDQRHLDDRRGDHRAGDPRGLAPRARSRARARSTDDDGLRLATGQGSSARPPPDRRCEMLRSRPPRPPRCGWRRGREDRGHRASAQALGDRPRPRPRSPRTGGASSAPSGPPARAARGRPGPSG